MPVRREGKPDWRGNLAYGERFAEGGRSKIPHDEERAVIAQMLRWKGEGWSNVRIADELNRMKIPTKRRGKKWSSSVVNNIIKLSNDRSSRRRVKPEKSKSVEESEPSSGPDWVFPNKTGIGHWTLFSWREDPSNPRSRLRDAGKAVGIEGLTLESLRRFHLKNTASTRPTLNLFGDKISTKSDAPSPSAAGPTSAPRDSATIEDKSIDQAISTRPVEDGPTPWVGTAEELEREIDAIESEACRDVVRALIESRPLKLTRTELDRKSKHGDAVNLLRDLRDSGSRLGRALGFPGRGRKGTWIEIEIID